MTAAAVDPPQRNLGRWQSTKFQLSVAMLLRDWGLHNARPSPRAGTLSPAPPSPEDSGDLVGVAGWSIMARSKAYLTLSESVDAVTAMAAEAGVPNAATILARRGRGAADAYVVMTLRQFADVLVQLQDLPGPAASTRMRNS